ncbi:MAG TPA: hypothetical protein VEK56_03985 [Vicinamibacterales bacterium]|nr:hypothetical protein [Vicinamibacterales bacterium]
MADREVYSLPSTTDRSAMDEWGIYDPSRAGLEALRDRLDAQRRAHITSEAARVGASMRLLNRLLAREEKPATE